MEENQEKIQAELKEIKEDNKSSQINMMDYRICFVVWGTIIFLAVSFAVGFTVKFSEDFSSTMDLFSFITGIFNTGIFLYSAPTLYEMYKKFEAEKREEQRKYGTFNK